jgi:hypothetical protein
MDLKPAFSGLQRVVATTTLAALLFSTMNAQTGGQQQGKSNSSQGAFTLKVQTEIVLVNVVARDKQNKPVQDLKPEDFTVLEDGKPQKVLSFDSENLDTTPIAAPSVAAGPSQQTVNGQPSASSKPILAAKDVEKELSNKRVIA